MEYTACYRMRAPVRLSECALEDGTLLDVGQDVDQCARYDKLVGVWPVQLS